MAYNFYLSYLPISSTPSQLYRDDLQANINDQFDNASNLYTIEEENIRGTMEFSELTCRICHVISDKQTGEKLGDDYRELIFQNLEHDVFIGKRFRFDDNIFICINTDNYHYVTKSCVIRRCNNSFRFTDEFGNRYQEPCICNYKINDNSNDNNPNIIIPEGDIDNIILQYNQISRLITPNKRFLIGNPRVCYRVKGNGVNNYLNEKTFDDNSVQLTKIDVEFTPINESTDNIVDGYADAYETNYVLTINSESFEQNIGYTSTLNYSLTLNGVDSDNSIEWISSDDMIVSINSNGNIECLSEGNVTIICRMVNNNDISDSINIEVVAIPIVIKENIVNPKTSVIMLNKNVIYEVYQYENNIPNGSGFSFILSGADTTKYIANIIDNNKIQITSKGYSSTKLNILATNLVDFSTISWEVQLKTW